MRFCLKFVFSLFLIISLNACSTTVNDVLNSKTPKKNCLITDLQKKRFIIAHRGYWTSNVPENSRESLKQALMLDIYGTEFDIYETKDGKFVVNHDSDIGGMKIEETNYEELRTHLLKNGETIPLLSDFLKIKMEIPSSVKLVIDIKYSNVEKIVKLVDNYNLQDQTEYISFSIEICNRLVELGHGHHTYYLNGDIPPQELNKLGIGGIDYYFEILNSHHEWIEEAMQNGMKVITWTVDDPQLINKYLERGVYVTTNFPE
jgi:glycerophosphoryl diester phosphodiesterase